MDVVEYEGVSYHRSSAKWVDSSGLTVSGILQDKLNAAFAKTLNPSDMSVSDLLKHGDRFKGSGNTGLAIQYYEIASQQASERDLAYILPRLTSCYRIRGCPQEAIDILVFASKKYGQKMITSALLTSAAAAYCDLGDYGRAKKCCDRAFAQGNGRCEGELRAVYGRIKKESHILDEPVKCETDVTVHTPGSPKGPQPLWFRARRRERA